MELICPVCGCFLQSNDASFWCENNHRFDRSRKGAVNLLLTSGKGKHHGDDKLMVRSRTEFLNKGYYDPLSRVICDTLVHTLPDHAKIIDSGCGEGKYTADVLQSFQEHGKNVDILGIDISKDAISSLRSRSRDIAGVVASSAKIPVKDGTADCIMNLFSPLFPEEFLRVLGNNGFLIRAVPLEEHLIELKRAVYDNPYLNPYEDGLINGFSLIDRKRVEYSVDLNDNYDVRMLFQMTPYFYKTGKRDQEKLNGLHQLSVTFSFGVFLYSIDQEG